MKHAHREIMNHQRLLHPHVVQLKEVFAAKPYLALVMEFVPNGDMFQARGLEGREASWQRHCHWAVRFRVPHACGEEAPPLGRANTPFGRGQQRDQAGGAGAHSCHPRCPCCSTSCRGAACPRARRAGSSSSSCLGWTTATARVRASRPGGAQHRGEPVQGQRQAALLAA